MNARDLLRKMKSSLEIESQFGDDNIVIQMQGSPRLSRATVAVSVEGVIHLFEVISRDLGIHEEVSFTDT